MWASFHILNWKDDTKRRQRDPWVLLRSVAVMFKEKNKTKIPTIPSLKVTVPGPPCTLPGDTTPYRAEGLSDLMSPRCPVKLTPNTGHLSSLCCIVGLALFVECDWQHSAPSLACVWPRFQRTTLNLSGLSVLFTSVWDHDLGSSCSSHPHLYVGSLLHRKESFCSVCTSNHSYHLNPVTWVKVSIGCVR